MTNLASWTQMTSKPQKTILDQSGRLSTPEKVLSSILGPTPLKVRKRPKVKKTRLKGLKGPWRHDFKNFCVKCNSTFHLQRHHITYHPALTAFLCEDCHRRVTGLNARGSHVAGGNKKTKTTYTNKIRVILWRWFLANPWPVDSTSTPLLRLSKTSVRGILDAANFQYEKWENPTACKLKRSAGERLRETLCNVGFSS